MSKTTTLTKNYLHNTKIRYLFAFMAITGISAATLAWAYNRIFRKRKNNISTNNKEKNLEVLKEKIISKLDDSEKQICEADAKVINNQAKMNLINSSHKSLTKTKIKSCSKHEKNENFNSESKKRRIITNSESFSTINSTIVNVEKKNEAQSGHSLRSVESPSSEGSADSGRATGGFTSASPFDIAEQQAAIATTVQTTPYYEFEIPNSLVGLIIGVGGKTIKELCLRTAVKMLIRPHYTPSKFETHQICSVEGKRENINRCLHMIKGRFPKERFPDLNLKPVFPPTITPILPNIRLQPTPLMLPVGVPNEVYVSATLNVGHFFLQLPTHPSFLSLQLLDCYMLQIYGQIGGTPELPRPISLGIICAAPAYSSWFRAQTIKYYEEQDEVLIRYLDYGGYARVSANDLRQIRTDLMSLPMQAIEVFLANVEPIDGIQWSEEANDLFQKMCASKIIHAEVVGYAKEDQKVPCVVLHFVDENRKVHRMDNLLLQRNLARPADPSKTVFPKIFLSNANNNEEFNHESNDVITHREK